jgi:hypothetical protein
MFILSLQQIRDKGKTVPAWKQGGGGEKKGVGGREGAGGREE